MSCCAQTETLASRQSRTSPRRIVNLGSPPAAGAGGASWKQEYVWGGPMSTSHRGLPASGARTIVKLSRGTAMAYHYDPQQALEELAEDAHPPNPVPVRDMIFRARPPAGQALEVDRDFESYLAQFGELQKLGRRILQRLAPPPPPPRPTPPPARWTPPSAPTSPAAATAPAAFC